MAKLVSARAPRDGYERRAVWQLAAAHQTAARCRERARMVAASWDGLSVQQIAAKLGCREQTVRQWLHRFNVGGLDGLADRPRAGRPRRLTQAQRLQIVAMVTPPGPPGFDQATDHPGSADADGPGWWTLDTLAAAAQDMGIPVERSQIRRILHAEGVRWHKTRERP